jgi:hypothetical protein
MVLGPPPLAEIGLARSGRDVRAITPTALGCFFTFATLMTGAVSVTLFAPGGPLDAMWQIKPHEYEDLLLLRPASSAGFAALCISMAATAFGCLRNKRWGWMLAIAIFTINALGDALRALTGGLVEGLFGAAVAALIVWWLTRAHVRALFA